MLLIHSKSYYAMPHDSTEGFTYREQLIILCLILLFTLYVGLRVRKNLKRNR